MVIFPLPLEVAGSVAAGFCPGTFLGTFRRRIKGWIWSRSSGLGRESAGTTSGTGTGIEKKGEFFLVSFYFALFLGGSVVLVYENCFFKV